MEEKMKKMLFLMLFLLILGAVNVTSQVRIGGNGVPNGAAVLDLNATDAINTGTKGLALPRVSLTNVNTALAGSPTVNGMMVYNTNASVTGGSGAGIYYWVTNKWVKMLNSDFVEGDGIVGNEFSDTIPGGGLTKTGTGTAGQPYRVGIKNAGVTLQMLAPPLIDSGIMIFRAGGWKIGRRSQEVWSSPRPAVAGACDSLAYSDAAGFECEYTPVALLLGDVGTVVWSHERSSRWFCYLRDGGYMWVIRSCIY